MPTEFGRLCGTGQPVYAGDDLDLDECHQLSGRISVSTGVAVG